MNLAALLARQAAERPDAAALVEGAGRARRVTTFADLDARSAAAAHRLRARGLVPGDRVLVLTRLSSNLYALVGGLLRAGAVAVVPDVSLGVRGVIEAARRVPVRALVAPGVLTRLAGLVPALRRIPLRLGVEALTDPRGVRADPLELADDAPALLTFTSGSTGRPRLALRTHDLLAAQFGAVRAALDLRPGQVDLATLPVFVLANLAAGVTTVLPGASLRRPGRADGARLLAQMRAEVVTRVAASPALVERLLDADDGTLAALAHVTTGGGPVFPDLLGRLEAAAPRARVVALYGSTEAEPIAHVDAADVSAADRRAMGQGAGLLAGPPVPEVQLALLRPGLGPLGAPLSEAAFDALRVPDGAPGEIAVAGAHVLPGYVGGEGDAEVKITAGAARWHRTGDLGRLDAQGRLWLLGRVAAAGDVARGEPLPFAVEAAARAVPGVRRAALVVDGGRRVLAVEGLVDTEAVRAGLAWAHLDAVVRLKRIPLDRRHHAKVDLPALRGMLESEVRAR